MTRAGSSANEPSLGESVCIMLTPALGGIEGAIHGLFKLAANSRLSTSRVFVGELDIHITDGISVEMCSRDINQLYFVRIWLALAAAADPPKNKKKQQKQQTQQNNYKTSKGNLKKQQKQQNINVFFVKSNVLFRVKNKTPDR